MDKPSLSIVSRSTSGTPAYSARKVGKSMNVTFSRFGPAKRRKIETFLYLRRKQPFTSNNQSPFNVNGQRICIFIKSMLYREKQRNERRTLFCNSPRRLLPKKFSVFHTYALNIMLFVEMLVKKLCRLLYLATST